MLSPDFWQKKEAQVKSRRLKDLQEKIKDWERFEKEIQDLKEIIFLHQKNKTIDLKVEIEKRLENLKRELKRKEIVLFFQGKYDKNNALLSIHAGAGGVDAQDFAEMLLRMYLRFAERKKFQAEISDLTKGKEAGIKTATLFIKGDYAYGWLKGEAGVHRLVRISPFDAEKMRHTSFTLIEVLPELKEIEEKEIEINPKDLKIETFLASGHGGQAVQKIHSAVRITHLPTKITVRCQKERSQRQNKEFALKILKAKLLAYYQKQLEKKKEKLKGEIVPAEWGYQIRSYILHPYKLVKDHRTGCESKDVQAVLDGQIDFFIEEYLKKQKLK